MGISCDLIELFANLGSVQIKNTIENHKLPQIVFDTTFVVLMYDNQNFISDQGTNNGDI